MRIRERRLALKITQEELSFKTGIAQAIISKYEREENDPKGQTLSKIADALDTSTDYLLERTDDPTPPQNVNTINETEAKIIAALRRGDKMTAAQLVLNN